jgi:hypothetical protein
MLAVTATVAPALPFDPSCPSCSYSHSHWRQLFSCHILRVLAGVSICRTAGPWVWMPSSGMSSGHQIHKWHQQVLACLPHEARERNQREQTDSEGWLVWRGAMGCFIYIDAVQRGGHALQWNASHGFHSCRHRSTISMSFQSRACLADAISLFCSPVL